MMAGNPQEKKLLGVGASLLLIMAILMVVIHAAIGRASIPAPSPAVTAWLVPPPRRARGIAPCRCVRRPRLSGMRVQAVYGRACSALTCHKRWAVWTS
jgi:hypothetical protein